MRVAGACSEALAWKPMMEAAEVLRLREVFAQHFPASAGSPQESALSHAPGRVNLIGEHTDYNDGYVLPMAIDFGVALYFRACKDERVRLYATNPGEMGEFPLFCIERSEKQAWLNYPMGVAAELLEEGVRLRGLEGVIHGDLPIGAGLSSSAALEVASAQAFLFAAKESIDLRRLALLCQRAENRFVGINCGIMDQFVALFAQVGTALFLDTRTLEYRHLRLPPAHRYVVVICDSGVKHALATSEYNKRRQECEQALALLRKHLPNIRALRDVSAEEFRRYQDDLP